MSVDSIACNFENKETYGSQVRLLSSSDSHIEICSCLRDSK